MASTAALSTSGSAGFTTLPGLKLSPYGAVLNNIKVYSFGVTSTMQVSATSTAINYTVSGLTAADIPISLTPSTGTVGAGVHSMFVSAANTLTVQWDGGPGTSTAAIPGLAAPGACYTLLTYSYETQASSTTT